MKDTKHHFTQVIGKGNSHLQETLEYWPSINVSGFPPPCLFVFSDIKTSQGRFNIIN